jgi:16S rRNA A1518/A1519 N6-dimethyltransferase RsmA/KsgA/DIM1 with predicted DNA glycosylase/AP lyase activity
MSDVWTFRPGTVDRMIYNGVVGHNEYQLPARFTPSDVVIDVGAHIGSFAHAVVQRGCRQVRCFEPDDDNCRSAAAHLRNYIDAGWVRLSRTAVWRSDANDDQLRFDGYQPFP